MRFIFCILTICVSLALPSWNTYEPERIFSLVNPNASEKVQLGIRDSSSQSIITFANQVKRSSY